jgi:chromate reductase, NAD(P)H dehydrogenase (quinone)
MTESRSATRIRALGIAGSLREGSYNRALLRAARDLAPDGLEICIFEGLADIPLYNEDVRAQGDPEPVTALKEAIRQADALVIAAPEYNYSIPGVLKNAIDWASRPPDTSPLNGKPVAIMGATTGSWGTVRSQMHLRQVCVYTNMLPMNKPQVLVARARNKFDAQGHLVDETTRRFVRQQMEALVEWALRLR